MTKFFNLAWLLKEIPFGFHLVQRYLLYLPGAQNWLHTQMTEIEYRHWHSDLVGKQGISCYQCGGTEKVQIALRAKQCGIACARCKSILWRQAATV
ncbi:hypothetical protein [Chitinibacter tainanensis]|uniref:hypothetical protein n=1 Tax=Chitinibacter tainanensis TaxID=230667 RepID=UPI002355397D|nr:hypothetical protein [Chitinibacter tainanensis]